jgi:neutral ceramidase
MFESTQIIGNNQYEHAIKLMNEAKEEITGPIDFRHSWLDMPSVNVKLDDGSNVNLCRPAMGYSFAAGTTDGPGMMNFTQGVTTGNPFWDKVRDFLSTPTEEEIACQAPKPILFNTGDLETPYPWDPTTVPLQILRIGNLFICAPPSEFTTMAGRRLRDAIKSVIRASGIVPESQEIYITIAGLSNSYSSYVTTFEEYQAQRYEAASTIYGPNTLSGYIQEFTRLTNDLINGVPSTSAAPPPDLTDVQIMLNAPGTPFDRTPIGTKFGDVVEGKDVLSSYTVSSTAKATFHSANPRNNMRPQGTYLTVEKKSEKGLLARWETVAVDADWETKFHWVSGKEDPLDLGLVALSEATVEWNIPSTTAAGTYRLCHQGTYKKIGKEHTLVDFTGCSSEFTVSAQ